MPRGHQPVVLARAPRGWVVGQTRARRVVRNGDYFSPCETPGAFSSLVSMVATHTAPPSGAVCTAITLSSPFAAMITIASSEQRPCHRRVVAVVPFHALMHGTASQTDNCTF